MARDLRSSNVADLDAAATLDGTEVVGGEQNGRDVKITTTSIAALGGGGGGGPTTNPVSIAQGGTAATTAAAALTALGAQPLTPTINDQTGTTYTLVLGDNGTLVTLSNGSAIALTVPANASVAYPINTQIQILQKGAGQVTVGITTDTLNGTPGLKTRAQYSMATLTKITATSWVLAGDLSA
jgi:hypothetical protein